MRIIVLLFVSYLLVAKLTARKDSIQKYQSNIQILQSADTTVILFGDSSYQLLLHCFDKESNDQERNNAILTFRKKSTVGIKNIFSDSLYCMYPEIRFEDLNNDRVYDILIPYSTGARANPTYHLYLADLKNHNLIRVVGFEKLPNPSLDSSNNIISSIGLAGTNYYSFYRINSKNKLINLGHDYAEDPNDSMQYERTVKEILKVTSRENNFAFSLKQVVTALSKRDSTTLSKYIDKKMGVYILCRIGIFEHYYHYSTLGFSDTTTYPIVPFYDSVKLTHLNYARLPTWDCEKWNKTGTFMDTTKTDHYFSRTMRKLNAVHGDKIPEKTITQIYSLENKSRKIVIAESNGNDLILYLSFINNKWILTIIDKASTDCSV